MGQTSGGLLTWWNKLYPGTLLTQEHLRRMAGDFGRRINGYAKKHQIPIEYCEIGDRTKHKRAEKLPGMLERLQKMVVEFLGVVQAAHLSFIAGKPLDELAMPSTRGDQRLAGVDLQKPRMRAGAEAVVALAAQPHGFNSEHLAQRVRAQRGRSMNDYTGRKAAYDLRKLRGKVIVERIENTRRYRLKRPGIRTLAGWLILREKVLKPILAGIYRPKRGRPPNNIHPLDIHYQNLKSEMPATLQTLKLAA